MFHEIYLPFPPSDNDYYVKTKQGQFISQKGRKFRDEVAQAIAEQRAEFIDYRVLVEVVLFMPDLRIRDVANYMKALMDSLTKAKLWEDDQLVDQLYVFRGSKVYGGKTVLYIHDAGPVLKWGQAPP